MTKRLSSLVLAVVMAFTLVFSVGVIAFTENTAAASVTDSGTCGDDVTWTLENGVLTISGTGEMTTYNSTSSYPWADYKDYVKQIVIESGVTNISYGAFYYFYVLKSVTIPETVVSIDNYAFGNCMALSSISLGEGLTSIGENAFWNCTSLSSITLPESLTSIGNYAFLYCSGLTEITIPASVTSVGSYAFYGCSVLETVTFDGDAPSLGTNVWTSAVTIMYHSSMDGWDTAQESWSLPSGSSWVDLDSIVSADDFAVDYETLSLEVGSSASVSTNADEYVLSLLSWSSSDTSVASVSRNGLVTGLSVGTAVIAVQSEDGTYYAECTVTVTGEYSYLPVTKTVIDSDEAEVTSNISDNNYTKWSSVVNSYLYENDDGTLTRVEYTSDGVVVEVYSSELELVSTQTIENELSLFGGFYSGEEYNYLVFGQTNSGESDETEVIRVIKYSKDWERLDSYSVYGANTTTPFDAGSLRMTEVGDLLYIYTCHTMYDGHQANMTLVIDTSDMSLEYSYTDEGIIGYGYVSHSFNQFIQTDGENVYRVDHGDSYPRAVSIIRSAAGSSITNVSYTEAFEILGTVGANNTGVSVGGFELSTDNCIIAGNSVDMSDSSTYSASGTRNIFITVTNKNLSSTSTIWLTDYTSDDGITVRTPQLVKINSEIFLVMWEEYTSDGITTNLVLINGDGEILTDITELKVRLSDCQPVVTSDGIVTWYVTDGSNVIFYQINPYRLSETVVKDSIEKATVTLNGTYTYTGSEITPEISVELEDGTVLTEGTDYTVEYSDNINVGTAVVTITGTGDYEGTLTAEFSISAKSIATTSTSIVLSESEYIYDGNEKEPGVTVTVDGMELAENIDFTVTYSENTDAGEASVTITGIGNYKDTVSTAFIISARSIEEAQLTLSAVEYKYDGTQKTPDVTVTLDGTVLTEGTEYTVTYSDNEDIGTAIVTVTGIGNYTGTVTASFDITETGHTLVETARVDSTCIEAGTAAYWTCSVCGKMFADEDAQTQIDAPVKLALADHTYDDGVVTAAATCTETGIMTYTCMVCGITKTEEIAATGHSFTDYVSNGDATCTEDGTKTAQCDNGCGETDTVTDEGSALGHSFTNYISNNDATCTEDGTKTAQCDNGCGTTDTVTDEGSAPGHAYGEPVWSWSNDCSEATAAFTCSVCGYEQTVEAEVSVVTTAPTCTEEGSIEYTASAVVDGTEYTDTQTITLPATGHSYEAAATDPTCTEDGYTTYTCTVCGDTYTAVDEGSATGHSFTDYVSNGDATCTEDGTKTAVCDNGCGETDTVADEGSATGHTYDSGVITTAASCTEDGVMTYTCIYGDDSYTETIPALGHDYEAVVTEPTCTEEGYTTYTCTRCGDTYTDNVTEALGHDYEAVITEPTCTEGGYTTYTCTRCGDTYTDDVTEALGHDYVGVETAATCTEDSYITYTCTRCGDSYVFIIDGSALGHDYEAVVTEPTCTEEGYTTYTCTRCGDTYTDDVTEALGHDYEAVVTEPTCTEGGYTTYTCTVCGDSYVSDETAATGHSYEAVITKEATETEDGLITYTCTVCGDTYTEVIPATGTTEPETEEEAEPETETEPETEEEAEPETETEPETEPETDDSEEDNDDDSLTEPPVDPMNPETGDDETEDGEDEEENIPAPLDPDDDTEEETEPETEEETEPETEEETEPETEEEAEPETEEGTEPETEPETEEETEPETEDDTEGIDPDGGDLDSGDIGNSGGTITPDDSDEEEAEPETEEETEPETEGEAEPETEEEAEPEEETSGESEEESQINPDTEDTEINGTEDSGDIEGSEDTEDTGDIEGTADTETTGDIENSADSEDSADTEDAADAEDTADTADTEDTSADAADVGDFFNLTFWAVLAILAAAAAATAFIRRKITR